MRTVSRLLSKTIFAFWLALVAAPALAQEEAEQEPPQDALEDPTYITTVEVDGVPLFDVRGSSALPAEERAALVAQRIEKVATANETQTVQMRIEQNELGQSIFADNVMISVTTKADASHEQLDIVVLAALHAEAIEEAILSYRANRTDEAFSHSTVTALLWSGAFFVYFLILLRLRKRVPRLAARLMERHTKVIQEATGDIVQSHAVLNIFKFVIRLIVDATLFGGFYYYLSFVLHSFPNTRPLAGLLIRYVTDPILNILSGFVAYLPNLITIAIIAAMTRWMIKGVRLFFESVDAGVIELKTFERYWVWPTYNLIRWALILVAAVVCFPYIPGSDSAAFQGLTILVGVMVSLGSNSVISNVLAGLFVLYKRSMNIGDRIRVGDHYGDVMQIRLMETYIKSVKNELVSIPNATLLNTEVINYSSKIDGKGLLLHTTVGIGYEEPRKKVEAMLIEAARRTKGLKNSPAPFVLVTGLLDFAINYQINAFTTRGSYLPLLLSDLHKNITDVFNENGVQIMTPNYESDTPDLKISDAQWDAPLAHEISKDA